MVGGDLVLNKCLAMDWDLLRVDVRLRLARALRVARSASKLRPVPILESFLPRRHPCPRKKKKIVKSIY